jgi:hypothetical protein
MFSALRASGRIAACRGRTDVGQRLDLGPNHLNDTLSDAVPRPSSVVCEHDRSGKVSTVHVVAARGRDRARRRRPARAQHVTVRSAGGATVTAWPTSTRQGSHSARTVGCRRNRRGYRGASTTGGLRASTTGGGATGRGSATYKPSRHRGTPGEVHPGVARHIRGSRPRSARETKLVHPDPERHRRMLHVRPTAALTREPIGVATGAIDPSFATSALGDKNRVVDRLPVQLRRDPKLTARQCGGAPSAVRRLTSSGSRRMKPPKPERLTRRPTSLLAMRSPM